MVTSPDSPPIGYEQENKDHHANDDRNVTSHKPTPEIDKFVRKIQQLNEDTTARHNKPQVQVVFPESDKPENNSEAIKAIEEEMERIEREQTSIISIIPAPLKSPHCISKDKSPMETNLQQSNIFGNKARGNQSKTSSQTNKTLKNLTCKTQMPITTNSNRSIS